MATAQELIDIVTIGFQEKLDDLNAAKEAANQAATAALAQYENAFAIGLQRTLYYDETSDLENTTGLSADSPATSWEQLTLLFRSGLLNNINLMSDVTVDYVRFISAPPAALSFTGRGVGNVGLQQRTMRFVDAINIAGWAGGLYFYAGGGVEISPYKVDIEAAYTAERSPIHVQKGRFEVWIQTATISRTGTSSRAIFGGEFSAHFDVKATSIDPSAAGYIIQNVPAGGDPNVINGITASFTQA